MTNCRECGQPITFKRLPNGRLCPTNPDGSDHFDLCSQIRGERVRQEGVHFERAATTTDNEREEGYRWQGKDKFIRLTGKRIVGPNYVPLDHDCPTPPWEECTCPR